jgi:hypothetical protein
LASRNLAIGPWHSDYIRWPADTTGFSSSPATIRLSWAKASDAMDIIIIGGGIGGLTLALTLHASGAGHRVRVFEAAAEMRALGVGINSVPTPCRR